MVNVGNFFHLKFVEDVARVPWHLTTVAQGLGEYGTSPVVSRTHGDTCPAIQVQQLRHHFGRDREESQQVELAVSTSTTAATVVPWEPPAKVEDAEVSRTFEQLTLANNINNASYIGID